ncbi:transposase [Domibacillus epiphyticus]|uniref:transposase n=1 Tax=Domibacillus epiphyticus TaxID=1714355 RepID=UPI0038BBC5D7
MLATELTAFLYYEKYDRMGFNSGNFRHGACSRTLHKEYGDLESKIPRDRNGEFKQRTVAPYRRTNGYAGLLCDPHVSERVMMSEISDLIEKMYSPLFTPQMISNMTKAMAEQVEAFKQCALSPRYVYVYLNATYYHAVKRETVSKIGCLSVCRHPGRWLMGRAGIHPCPYRVGVSNY